MARIGIIFGIALCGLTVGGLVTSPLKSPYQFIPMILGIPLLFLGVVALNPHRRRQSMHVAASISTMGLLVGGGRLIYMLTQWAEGLPVNVVALRMVVAMSLLCLLFVAVWLVSWWQLRRRNRIDPLTGAPPPVSLPPNQRPGSEHRAPILGQDSERPHDFANRD